MITNDTYLTVRQLCTLTDRSVFQIRSLIHDGLMAAYRPSPKGMIWIRVGDAIKIFPMRFPDGAELPYDKQKVPKALKRIVASK